MPLTVRAQTADQVLREEVVGIGDQRICYPGVSSCISVTALHPAKLIGAHITAYTTAAEVATIFRNLAGCGGNWCYTWYVVGKIKKFKELTSVPGLKTRKLMTKYIRDQSVPNATVWFFDTGEISDSDVFAVKNGSAVNFSYRPGTTTSVSGFTYPNAAGATAINATAFVVR